MRLRNKHAIMLQWQLPQESSHCTGLPSIMSFGRKMLLQQTDNLHARTYTMEVIATYLGGRARWQDADHYLQRTAELAQQLGHSRIWEEATSLIANNALLQGRWDQSLTLYQEVDESSGGRGDRQIESWAILRQGILTFRKGDHERALDFFLRCLPILNEHRDYINLVTARGMLAITYLRSGQAESGRQFAQDALSLMQQYAPTFLYFGRRLYEYH